MYSSTSTPTTIAKDIKKYRIRIHKQTIHLLGDPKYIQLLVNPLTMAVAIRPVEKELSGDQSHKVNMSLMNSDNSYEIYSRSFITRLCEVIGGLETNCSYRLSGEVISSKAAAVFSLKTIKRIEPEVPNGN